MTERQNDADSVWLVITTFPTIEVARQIGTQLVESQLAACVNILPGVESIYSWKGKIERDDELVGLIKTTGTQWDALESWIQENHPYDEPEVIAIPIEKGSSGYLEWVRSSMKGH